MRRAGGDAAAAAVPARRENWLASFAFDESRARASALPSAVAAVAAVAALGLHRPLRPLLAGVGAKGALCCGGAAPRCRWSAVGPAPRPAQPLAADESPSVA
mmetsp:Transcript_58192/g.126383  ORF Transcript_58192/g.126383 Transcript_58192/m.126383 type:complete len:102 (+) Transcript_58192:564-869(+)